MKLLLIAAMAAILLMSGCTTYKVAPVDSGSREIPIPQQQDAEQPPALPEEEDFPAFPQDEGKPLLG